MRFASPKYVTNCGQEACTCVYLRNRRHLPLTKFKSVYRWQQTVSRARDRNLFVQRRSQSIPMKGFLYSCCVFCPRWLNPRTSPAFPSLLTHTPSPNGDGRSDSIRSGKVDLLVHISNLHDLHAAGSQWHLSLLVHATYIWQSTTLQPLKVLLGRPLGQLRPQVSEEGSADKKE